MAEQILANHPDALILDCLKITRVVKAQVGQTAKLRKESSMDLYRWSGPRLNGKTCVLIDDVCTTGATLSDAARALREVGARGVNAFVLAQTPPKRDQNQSITT